MHYADIDFKHYLHDTRGLDPLHHGVYLLLLFAHLGSERPLRRDMDEIYCQAEARTVTEKKAVDRVLRKFWLLLTDGWIQKRAFLKILDYQAGSAVRAASGRGEKGHRKPRFDFELAKRTLADSLADCPQAAGDLGAICFQVDSKQLANLVNHKSGTNNQESGTNNHARGAGGGELSPEAWAEKIIGAYPRRDCPMESLAAVVAVLRSGTVKPEIVLANVLRIAQAAARLPGGAKDHWVWTAKNFFGGQHWTEPEAFELRVQSKLDELKKNKGVGTEDGDGPPNFDFTDEPDGWRVVWEEHFDEDPPSELWFDLPASTRRDLVRWTLEWQRNNGGQEP